MYFNQVCPRIMTYINVCVSMYVLQIPEHSGGDASRERNKEFTYDHSYWTVDKADPRYSAQDKVCFQKPNIKNT